MNFKLVFVTIIAMLALSSCSSNPNADVTIKTENDKISYSLGINIAEQAKNSGLNEVNSALVAKGVEDYYSGNNLAFSADEALQILNDFFMQQQAVQAGDNLAEENKFFAENKDKEGIITLASGLQYKILTAGTGNLPTKDDTVKVHYQGTLLDGSIFDSSIERGEPVEFPVNAVIPGWTEALQLMPVGSKWQLFVPSTLAYGEMGKAPQIEPNSALIFEVELIAIQ